MAQQVQFVYLGQSEYDALESKSPGQLYFTSDTHRIYRGTELYAKASIDEATLTPIYSQTPTYADEWTFNLQGDFAVIGGYDDDESKWVYWLDIDGMPYGGNHYFDAPQTTIDFSSDYPGLIAEKKRTDIIGYTLGSQTDKPIAPATHTHSELSGITESSIAKTSATFQDLTVTGDVTFSVDQLDFQSLTASSITVDGKSVSLDGHVHSASDISDFTSSVVSIGASVFASASHTHDGLQGLTSSTIGKDSATFNQVTASAATFDNLVITGDVTMSLSQVQFGSIMASEISVNGSSVSLEGHAHTMSQITGLESYVSAFAAYESRIAALESMVSGLEQALHSINTGA